MRGRLFYGFRLLALICTALIFCKPLDCMVLSNTPRWWRWLQVCWAGWRCTTDADAVADPVIFCCAAFASRWRLWWCTA